MANSVAGDMDGDNVHDDNSSLKEPTDAQTQGPASRSASNATVVLSDQSNTGAEREEQSEALIQAAARDIIEKIEQDRKHGQRPSNSSRNGNYETESSYKEGFSTTLGQDTELSQENGTDMRYEGGKRTNGTATPASASEDEVFSHGRTPSGGSNNSSDALNTDEEARYKLTKEIAEEVERQQAANFDSQPSSDHEDQGFFDQSCDESETPMVSRAPSYATTTIQGSAPQFLLNDQLNIPDFRSPSAMRALQMSSPAPSVFSGGSPMSRKRPTSSHLRTPQMALPKKTGRVTPLFAKQEESLALLHCFVLPLKWPHGDLLENAPNDVLSKDLLAVKQAWKVLKDKLGGTVLNRGVLIAHPQDSYETLDERLCGALELPRRPRAKILDCGHYLGPTNLVFDEDTDDSSSEYSDDDDSDNEFQMTESENTYCDVCCRDVRVGKYDKYNKVPRKKTFKVKVYAKNGLMGSGAWAACWRQIENVDVEIEPAVGPGFSMEIADLFDMAMATRQQVEDEQGQMQYEEEVEVESPQIVIEEAPPAMNHQEPATPAPTYQEATRPSTAVTANQEPAYMEARSFESSPPPAPESVRMLSPEPSALPIVALPAESKIRHLEDEMRRIEEQEARNREIYGNEQKQAPPLRSESRRQYHEEEYHPERRHSRNSSRMSNKSSPRRQKPHVDEDSLVDLLLAAARVLLSDAKNLIIGFLAILVVVFAMRSGGSNNGTAIMGGAAVGVGGLGGPVQPQYETAFQRQEATMQRLQMEDVVRMRAEAEAISQRPAASYQAPNKAYGEDGQRVQHVAQHGGQPPVYIQQPPVAPAVPIKQVPVQPAIQQPVIQAPPPVQHVAEDVKPVVPAAASIDIVDSIKEMNIAGAEVAAKAAAGAAEVYVAAAGFAIPTPPASIKEGGVAA